MPLLHIQALPFQRFARFNAEFLRFPALPVKFRPEMNMRMDHLCLNILIVETKYKVKFAVLSNWKFQKHYRAIRLHENECGIIANVMSA